jgi:hypothetical protein
VAAQDLLLHCLSVERRRRSGLIWWCFSASWIESDEALEIAG